MKLTLEYIAGFVDGEGCIRTEIRNYVGNKGNRDANSRLSIVFSIVNTDKDVIYAIRESLGCGTIIEKSNEPSGRKLIYDYRIHNHRDVVKILNLLKPYLVVKRYDCEKTINDITNWSWKHYELNERDNNEVKKLYLENKLSITQIHKRLNIPFTSLARIFRELKIKKRTHSEEQIVTWDRFKGGIYSEIKH